MPLTLKIVSPTTLPQGQEDQCVFDELGGSIGRKTQNDFVLIDPERFISSKHASIEYKQGKFFITDTSTNGVFLNNGSNPLGVNHSQELANGDKINIGDYQMQVIVNEQASTQSTINPGWEPEPIASELEDPFAQFDQAIPPPAAQGFDQGFNAELDLANPFADSGVDASVDPLALLDGDITSNNANGIAGVGGAEFQSTPSQAATPADFGFNSSSGLDSGLDNNVDNFFADAKSDIPPPSPLNEPFTPPSTSIPDDWDIMGGDDLLSNNAPAPTTAEQHAGSFSDPATPKNGESINAFEDDIFAALEVPDTTHTPQAPAIESAVALESPGQAQTPAPLVDNQAIDDFLSDTPSPQSIPHAEAMAPQAHIAPISAPVTPPTPVAQTTPPPPIQPTATPSNARPTNEDGDALLQAFFQGAGIDPQRLSFADKRSLMLKIGLLTRTNTEGLMIALRARTTIKSSFRVNKTIIAPVENNPLKFLVTADDALATILSDDRPGYMPAKQAVDEGYSDLQTHQMAMMAGMQATIRAILDQFNPNTLEQSFSRSGSGGGLLGSKKAKNWDHYAEFYQKLSDQLVDDFQNLFGEEFAKAYEAQVQKLTNSR